MTSPGTRRPRRRRPDPTARSCGAARGTAARARGRRRVQTRDAVDARDLERLGRALSGGRIDGSRRASIVLPVPGGPAEQEVVTARGATIVSAPQNAGVSAHVGEVDAPASAPRSAGSGRAPAAAAPRHAAPRRPPAGSRPRAPRRPSTSAASPRVRARDDESAPGRRVRAPSATASAPRTGRTSPPSDSSPKTAQPLERSAGELAAGREHAAGDRQVEARARLAQVRRREVDVIRAVAGTRSRSWIAARTRSRASRTGRPRARRS